MIGGGGGGGAGGGAGPRIRRVRLRERAGAADAGRHGGAGAGAVGHRPGLQGRRRAVLHRLVRAPPSLLTGACIRIRSMMFVCGVVQT